MIGANDICSHMCYLKTFSDMPRLHKNSLIKALDYLRDKMPRTIVNLVSPPSEYVRNRTHAHTHTLYTAIKFCSFVSEGSSVYLATNEKLLLKKTKIN